MSKVWIDLQKVSKEKHNRPHKRECDRWFSVLIDQLAKEPSLPNGTPLREEYSFSVRIVDEEEIMKLNSRYRGKSKSTNVLSFPFESPVEETDDYLGDVVMCGAVIANEASEMHIDIKEYWAKMFVHACLHLFGYTHETEEEDQAMEKVAERILQTIYAAQAA